MNGSDASPETSHSPSPLLLEASSSVSGDLLSKQDHLSEPPSIYDLYTNKQRYIILTVGAFVGLLLPFADTIYLPALTNIEHDLHTSQTIVEASVALFMIMVGIFSLFWGVTMDTYGRSRPMLLSMLSFMAVTLVCILAPTSAVLLVFRALQGATVSALMIGGLTVVADVFPLHQRGFALGIATTPILVGPVIGPIIGGALSQAFGWRSTFIALEILAGPLLVLMFFVLHDTHPFFVMQKLTKTDPKKAALIQDPTLPSKQPVFVAPWRPLLFFRDPAIWPYAAINLVDFGCMYVSMAVLPIVLTLPPYNLSESLIGLCYIPSGMGVLVGCLMGGKLSDMASARYAHLGAPLARLLPSCILGFTCPIGVFLYGWTFANHINLAAPLVASVLTGLGNGFYQPGLMSYLTGLKQDQAAAASAAVNCLSFIMAGILVLIAVPLIDALGIGVMFSIIGALSTLVLAVGLTLVLRQMRQSIAQPSKDSSQTDTAGTGQPL